MRISDWSSDVCSSDLGKRCVPFSAIGIPEAGVRCHAGMDAFPAQQGSDPAGHSAVRRADGFRGLSVDAPARSWPDGYFLFRLAFAHRSEEHKSELQSLMRISYAVFCLKKQNERR